MKVSIVIIIVDVTSTSVVFRADAQIEQVINDAKNTHLLGWFKANQDPVFIAAGAHYHLYQEFLKNFVWNQHCAVWKICQRYKTIGCMYFAYPNQGEIF